MSEYAGLPYLARCEREDCIEPLRPHVPWAGLLSLLSESDEEDDEPEDELPDEDDEDRVRTVIPDWIGETEPSRAFLKTSRRLAFLLGRVLPVKGSS
jgi:hypothetical protein